MSCRFCPRPAPDAGSAVCNPCRQLIQAGSWHLLAHLWLSYRPEDWVPDVAAFLEYTEGAGDDVARPHQLLTP
jgi:hypothetical protein